MHVLVQIQWWIHFSLAVANLTHFFLHFSLFSVWNYELWSILFLPSDVTAVLKQLILPHESQFLASLSYSASSMLLSH